MVDIVIPKWLADYCSNEERREWLAGLPGAVAELSNRWQLELGPPFEREPGPSLVLPATLAAGGEAILKLGMPHMEATHEIDALRFWNGDGAARLLQADVEKNALLLERCRPGTLLRERPEEEQDEVIAGLLRRLWRTPDKPHPFRPLAEMTARWGQETRAAERDWPDAGLVRAALQLYDELPRSPPAQVLLATDLHAANVLRAEREEWLVIDPKPFVGDAAYDATQHLFNCSDRLCGDPLGTIGRFADLLGVESERVRLWVFARAATGPWDFDSARIWELVRKLAP
ncbi:MAG: aminoglycoside phosphotransferase [Candidatus Latescibacteria bacterium]|nr:aminoglycoside phosphotransferase [Candidatus Latescibacterota bacterium]